MEAGEMSVSMYRAAGLMLAAVAILVSALVLLSRAMRRVRSFLEARVRALPPLRVQHMILLPPDRAAAVVGALVHAVHVAAGLLLVYFSLPLVFSFHPSTQGWSRQLVNWVAEPLLGIVSATVRWLPDLLFIVVVVVVVRYALKLVRLFVPGVESGAIVVPGFHPEWALPTYQLFRAAVFVFTLVVIFPYLPGSGTPAFRGISVMVGVILSLGGASSFSSLISGVILTYMRPFRVGDRVRIGDTTGDVTERTLLVTRVRTIKNEDVTVPNALVLGAHIVNYSSCAGDRGLILHTAVTIGYDVPWRKVHELLIEAARGTEGVMQDPSPFVLQTALGDYAVTYEINAYTDRPAGMAAVYSLLYQRIQDAFAAAGVEIMSPAWTALRDGNKPAIPRQDPGEGPRG